MLSNKKNKNKAVKGDADALRDLFERFYRKHTIGA